jgi:hypothetical protein
VKFCVHSIATSGAFEALHVRASAQLTRSGGTGIAVRKTQKEAICSARYSNPHSSYCS